jgi:hypothetical protein
VVEGQGSVHIIDVVQKVEKLQVVIFANAFYTLLEPIIKSSNGLIKFLQLK